MGGVGPDDGSTYSPAVAFIYVFNLVVGTGALALPSVLTTGGWLLGSLFLIIVAASSYIGVTFMIESMAAANAVLALEKKDLQGARDAEPLMAVDDDEEEGECGVRSPIHRPSPFDISRRVEMGQMADMFFGTWGRILFYAALILYLFGDAAIYCTFIPRSLVGFTFGDNPPSWAFDAYLAIFVLLIVPFCFFDFQKTKLLQMFTLVIRNAAILTMIALAAWLIFSRGSQAEGVPQFKISALPNLFGGAVYAFMCHHSLPGIITPMRDKHHVSRVLRLAFSAVFILYFLLFVACGIAFGLHAQDPITFNFPPSKFGWIGDMLYLFPVFTLSSNFPMLTITLRNNLDTLLQLAFQNGLSVPIVLVSPRFIKDSHLSSIEPSSSSSKFRTRHVLVTFLAVGPPIACCIMAEHYGLDVSSLVGITGAYAGAVVMFIIPACLVHSSRQAIHGLSTSLSQQNPFSSPFRSSGWVMGLILFSILAAVFIACDQLLSVS